MPPKKSLDDQMTFPIKAAQKARVEKLAARYGVTKSDFMRRIVDFVVQMPNPEIIMTAAPEKLPEPTVEG